MTLLFDEVTDHYRLIAHSSAKKANFVPGVFMKVIRLISINYRITCLGGHQTVGCLVEINDRDGLFQPKPLYRPIRQKEGGLTDLDHRSGFG
ncbi:MAG: hypothetical protein ACU836_04110 [Gammaproteobacteria bacterium]